LFLSLETAPSAGTGGLEIWLNQVHKNKHGIGS
jgi:hypothetical protein